MLPFYTRWLSVADYGTTDMITVYSTLLVGVVACCIYDALLVFPKDASIEKKKTYLTSGGAFLIIAFLATFVFFVFLSVLSSHFSINNSFFQYIWLVFLMIVSDVLLKCAQSYARSIDKMVAYSLTGIVVTLCTALFSFIFIPSYGIYGYVMSFVLANIIAAIVAFLYSKSYYYLDYKTISTESCRKMLAYSIPLIPNALMWWIVNAINRPLMERYVGLEGIGIFAIANKFPGLMSMLYSIFLVSWQLSVLEEFGKKGYEVFYNRILRLVTIMSSLFLIVITLFSKIIIRIFASSNFYESWKYVSILTLGMLFSNIGGFVGCNFSAARKSKYYFYSSLWSALSAVLFNFLLIPTFGIWGAVVSFSLALFVMAVSRIVYSWRYVHIQKLFLYLMLPILDVIVFLLILNSADLIIVGFITAIVVIIHILFLEPLSIIKKLNNNRL